MCGVKRKGKHGRHIWEENQRSLLPECGGGGQGGHWRGLPDIDLCLVSWLTMKYRNERDFVSVLFQNRMVFLI